MLKVLGYETLDALVDARRPGRRADPGRARASAGDDRARGPGDLRHLAATNVSLEPMIGLGYYGTITPPVIRRNLLESPAWYTAYTPYQPEISQGRLEALLNFQTMVATSRASPRPTRRCSTRARRWPKPSRSCVAVPMVVADRVVVDADCLPQTLAVLRTRLGAARDRVSMCADLDAGLPEGDFFGLVQQYPGCSGAIRDFAGAHAMRRTGAARWSPWPTDLLALTLLHPRANGVPTSPSDPHNASASRCGTAAHTPPSWPCRRASSGTCPAAWSGCPSTPRVGRPTGWRCRRASSTSGGRRPPRTSARRRYSSPWRRGCTRSTTGPTACAASRGRCTTGRPSWRPRWSQAASTLVHRQYFDTLVVRAPGRAADVVERRGRRRACSCAWSTTTTSASRAVRPRPWTTCSAVLAAFGFRRTGALRSRRPGRPRGRAAGRHSRALLRRGPILGHPVFSRHHSETAMLRYLRDLSDRDFALDRGMIPLGSCTMKLNATTEMEPVSLPGFADVHPFAPPATMPGFLSARRRARSLAGPPHRVRQSVRPAQRGQPG